jgi:hypothetical protein
VWVSSTHLLAAAETTEIGKAHKMRELYYGPYKIIRWRGPATLELDIPANVWPIKAKSAIFPVSRLKPYRETRDRTKGSALFSAVGFSVLVMGGSVARATLFAASSLSGDELQPLLLPMLLPRCIAERCELHLQALAVLHVTLAVAAAGAMPELTELTEPPPPGNGLPLLLQLGCRADATSATAA